MRVALVRWVVVSLALLCPSAWAQLPGLPKAPEVPAPAVVPPVEIEAPDSPRASARSFVDLAGRRGDFTAAARHLQLPAGEESRGPELARRLRAVLERHLHIDLDALSPAPEGNTQDGLPTGVDSVGQVPDGRGGHNPVFLVRTRDASGPLWAFSRQTVSRIDGWYDALPDRWVRELVPERLQRYGPAGLLWWQWLGVPLLALVSLSLGRLLGALTRRLLFGLARTTDTEWDERLLRKVGPALSLLWAVAAAAVLLPWLALLPPPERLARALLGGIATLGVVWALWRSVDVWARFLAERPGIADNPSARSLLALLRNFAKAFVALGGILATLAAFGYPVTTVLAGLGLGGVALAFGAQKTIENLFGSVALAVDQPFRVGDLVRVEDITGNVERIGMRSTQIRTPDRTLVSLPNGKLADMRIEDFAARDRIRFATSLGLLHGTSATQVRQVVAEIEALLRGMPKVWPDVVVSQLQAFSPSALEIEVMCWFVTPDFEEYRRLRQEALLGILQILEQAGTAIAPPTVQLAARRRPAPAAAAERPAAAQPIE